MEQKAKNSSLIVGGIEAVAAVFLILTVTKIAPVCTGMLETAAGKQVHMKCYYTSVVLILLAVLLLVNAILCMVKREKVVSGIMAVAISVVVFLILNDSVGIGVCANPDMACNMTVPFVKVCGAIGVIVGAISTYLGLKEKNK